jgi:hypothetical protein
MEIEATREKKKGIKTREMPSRRAEGQVNAWKRGGRREERKDWTEGEERRKEARLQAWVGMQCLLVTMLFSWVGWRLAVGSWQSAAPQTLACQKV